MNTADNSNSRVESQSRRRVFKIKAKLHAIRAWRVNHKNLRLTAKRISLHRSTLRRWIRNEKVLKKSNNREFRQNIQRE